MAQPVSYFTGLLCSDYQQVFSELVVFPTSRCGTAWHGEFKISRFSNGQVFHKNGLQIGRLAGKRKRTVVGLKEG